MRDSEGHTVVSSPFSCESMEVQSLHASCNQDKIIQHVYESKLLTQQANNHINSIPPGDHETRKKPTYRARADLDEAQRRGGRVRTTQQKTQSEAAKTVA